MNKSLSIFSANLLFALTLVLVVTLGAAVQSASLAWGLIATEVFLIALPALLFLRSSGTPLRQGLRLSLPETGFPKTRFLREIWFLALFVALGAAMYFFGLLIDGIMAQLSGLPAVPIQDSLLPKTGFDMAVYFVALAVSAPLCEEILFRGAVQGAYERHKSPLTAILVTAVLFAFYHLRLTGLPALLPVALVLGYVVWRTGSLYAGMLIHFGNNGASALNNILYFSTGQGLPFLSLWSGLAGLALAVILLALITRIYPRPAAQPAPEPAPRRSWLVAYWPLLPAAAVYLAVAGMTLAAALLPKAAPASQIQYGFPSVNSAVTSHYDIANQGGQAVGTLDCTLIPEGARIALTCKRAIRAYELQTGSSYFKDGDHTDTLNATWDGATMALESFDFERKSSDGSAYRSALKDGMLVTTFGVDGAQEAMELPQYAVIEFEWAWQAALLKANSGASYSLPLVWMLSQGAGSTPHAEAGPSVTDEVLRVGDDETLALPGGSVAARSLTLGRQTAWYAREDAIAGLPRPAKFDDGMVVYTLTR